MYHSAVHDARNYTLILVIQPQRYALHSATEAVNISSCVSNDLLDLADFTPIQCRLT